MIAASDLMTAFPEFRATDPGQVQFHIGMAAARLDAEVYGANLDTAIILLACHTMALSPMGQNARLESESGAGRAARTTYSIELDKLRLEVSQGYRITL